VAVLKKWIEWGAPPGKRTGRNCRSSNVPWALPDVRNKDVGEEPNRIQFFVFGAGLEKKKV